MGMTFQCTCKEQEYDTKYYIKNRDVAGVVLMAGDTLAARRLLRTRVLERGFVFLCFCVSVFSSVFEVCLRRGCGLLYFYVRVSI